jgi:CheY-like chemotaxis protein
MLKTILLIEDNSDDVFFMEQAKKNAGIRNPMQVLKDGRQALDYLQGHGIYQDRQKHPLPFLVLMDLKLPYVPGLEVLKWIRDRPELETMLIVILTSSKEDRDIDRAYRLGANSYLVKPPNAAKLQDMVKLLGEYWLGQNQPPIHIEEVAK